MRPGRAVAALAEHREVVAAIAARDADRAEAAIRRHIQNARANSSWAGVTAAAGSSTRAASGKAKGAKPRLERVG